jgi:hypothetical protein
MYPGYALHLRGKLGASLEPSLLELESAMVSPGLAGMRVQPCPRKKAISF